MRGPWHVGAVAIELLAVAFVLGAVWVGFGGVVGAVFGWFAVGVACFALLLVSMLARASQRQQELADPLASWRPKGPAAQAAFRSIAVLAAAVLAASPVWMHHRWGEYFAVWVLVFAAAALVFLESVPGRTDR